MKTRDTRAQRSPRKRNKKNLVTLPTTFFLPLVHGLQDIPPLFNFMGVDGRVECTDVVHMLPGGCRALTCWIVNGPCKNTARDWGNGIRCPGRDKHTRASE